MATARQVGKSTLCEAIAASEQRPTVSMDDQGVRAGAVADPAGFLAGFDGPVFIDEVQRVPELILAIKQIVDREQQPGRFLLSGSANILSSRKVQEALTGRIELKAKVSLSGDDTKGLVKLRDALADQFLAGAVLHAGEQTLPLGDRLWAIPVSGLWA